MGDDARTPIRLRVGLWCVPGEEEAFRRFEDRAMEIMESLGAKVLDVQRPCGEGTPDEVHLLEFPSQAAFDSYRADARLEAIAELRSRAILKTEVDVLPSPE